MFWTDDIYEKALAEFGNFSFLINDSKTPSGPAHVGSLRGALIHDAVYRFFKDKGVNVKFNFGSDDYDPMDEIPKGQEENFEKYLGFPLFQVPPPSNSDADDMANHFINDFFDVFKTLNIKPELYRMRDVYQRGQFNESIETILMNAHKVREIYQKISGSVKGSDWYPFQPICENCGRIGTTRTTNFDGKEVTYSCEPSIVSWAKGCSYKGKVSPFDGKGKLPWKLEWVAKWATFNINIEGAGMDHTTKGGSREVASAVLETVFKKKPPVNIPYGFFLVDGKKMSSSKGIGASAKDMSCFLPAEILRFLMLRISPKRSIDFSPSDKFINNLYSDFDTTKDDAFSKEGQDGNLARHTYQVSEPLCKTESYFSLSFSLLKTLVQLPHINVYDIAQNQKGSSLTELELARLNCRIDSVKFWLKHYATENDIFSLHKSLPSSFYEKTTPLQIGFLRKFLEDLKNNSEAFSSPENVQNQLFTSARLTPIPPKDAFKAIYLAFLDKTKGPVAGNLIYHLGKKQCYERFTNLQLDEDAFLKDASSTKEKFFEAITKEKESLEKIHLAIEPKAITATLFPSNGKVKLVRLMSESPKETLLSVEKELGSLSIEIEKT